MDIQIARTDAEITACYPVMRELRPHLDEEGFLTRIREQETTGYQLAFIAQQDGIVAVAGFRICTNLAWGRFLYVDDLVTLAAARSRGHGSRLLSWLHGYANARHCSQLHLDTGIQRIDAQRFYEREGMTKTGFHYASHITPKQHP